ncbi:MAG TPA: response regulator transcription factor [Gemmataceae bacterium]|nr:response regulator transcription factor [Gemmataceae bacterium]
MRLLLFDHGGPEARRAAQALKAAGFAVETAPLQEGGGRAWGRGYDVVLVGLPASDKAGLAWLQCRRREGMAAPVLALVGSDDAAARAAALNAGADGALSRTFHPAELVARVRALARRGRLEEEALILRAYDLEINTATRTVRRAGQPIRLTPQEYALLALLARHRGRVVTRSMIRKHLYDENEPAEGGSNVIEVYVRYLRRKIDHGFNPPLILTRWGLGYLLRGDDQEPRAWGGG